MILLLLFIAHLIGDFVFQTAKIATKKQNNFSELLYHSLLYAITVGLFLGVSVNIYHAIIPFLIISISHFIIDFTRIFIEKKAKQQHKLLLFFIDQIMHISIIILMYFVFNIYSDKDSILESIIQNYGFQLVNNTIVYTLIYLIMLQPSAVVVKKVFFHISNEDINVNSNSQLSQTKYAGYLIGILERIIIATLVLQGEMSTIGFVLAAKSLARFKQLEDQDFAEKYLVGTLISVAISIILTLFLKSRFI